MKIAIVSDTHDNTANTKVALELIRQRGVKCILHCGDICEPTTVELFRGCDVHFVQGNNDYELAELRAAAESIDAEFHGAFADLEMSGKRIAMLHGDRWQLLDRVQAEQAYDYVFFGHLHEFSWNQTGRTVVINPGALHRARPKSFVILNLASGAWEKVELPEVDTRPGRKRHE
jgi:putative phosphoesterase